MIRSLAALTAAVTAAIAAAAAALGLRRRKRAARRAERRDAKRAKRASRSPGVSAAAGTMSTSVTPATGTWAAPATAAPATAAPATAAPAGDPVSTGAAPSLRSIKGIGGVVEERLGTLGVSGVDQIAAWSDEDVERTAGEIHVSAERIRREDWVGQARRLVSSREA
jgi:predicted flap endonuclease-1-like 5' DNA nuclease